jgi:hypothetical protein
MHWTSSWGHAIGRLGEAEHSVNRAPQPDDPPRLGELASSVTMSRTQEADTRRSSGAVAMSLQLLPPAQRVEVRQGEADSRDAGGSGEEEAQLPGHLHGSCRSRRLRVCEFTDGGVSGSRRDQPMRCLSNSRGRKHQLAASSAARIEDPLQALKCLLLLLVLVVFCEEPRLNFRNVTQ